MSVAQEKNSPGHRWLDGVRDRRAPEDNPFGTVKIPWTDR